MSIVRKVKRPKLRRPTATPKEQQAWEAFVAFAGELKAGKDGQMPPMVIAELERLCAKGNAIAIRFKERLAIAAYKPRQATEAPAQPPVPRRIRALQWLHESDTVTAADDET